MSRNAFMPEDRSWIFNRRTNIKILRFRIVGRNEKESGWVLVINAGGMHGTAGAGWLKGFRQLSNLKLSKIIRQGYEIVFLQEADHFCFVAFVRFQERFLIGRNVSSPFRIWIG